MKREGIFRLVYTVIGVVFILAIAILLSDGKKSEEQLNKNASTKSTATPTPTEIPVEPTETFMGIFLEETDNSALRFKDIPSGITRVVTYTGNTYFYDSYDIPIAHTQLRVGEVYNIERGENTGKLVSVRGSNDYWEKRFLTNVKIDKNLNRITVNDQNYRINDGLLVCSNGKFVDADIIYPIDVLSLRGVGDTVYEIVITKGHGFIKLLNDEDFIGGNLNTRFYDFNVEEDGLYAVQEGYHSLYIAKGLYEGRTDVTIDRDAVFYWDLNDFGHNSKPHSNVYFFIDPLGAELYLNGKRTQYYDKALYLPCGVYKIEVSLGGYDTYEEECYFGEGDIIKNIWLNEVEAEDNEGGLSDDNTTN